MLFPLGTPDKFYAFLAILSAVIVGAHVRLRRARLLAAIAVAAFVVADALRILPTPDVALEGESFFGGWVRRPYFLSHPNSVAGWALLLPFGPWTLITVLAVQSRGALAGLGIGAIGYAPKRIRAWVALAAGLLFIGAAMIRPGTMLVRLEYWREGLSLFAARPLAGWGSSSYATAAYADEMNAITERSMPHAHNALVTIAAENGLLGLAPFCAMAGSLIALVRRSTHPARWGLLAFWAQQIVDDQWLHPVTAILLGLSLAVCLFERHPPTMIISAEIPLAQGDTLLSKHAA